MAQLNYIGLDCEIGYVPSGTTLSYDNIIKLGDYKYPFYAGKLDLSSYPVYGSARNLVVIYGDDNNYNFSDNISKFLSNFSTPPYSELCVFLSSRNSTLFNQTYSLAQQVFQYISINDAQSTYTIHFKDDSVYYAVSNRAFYIKNISDNATVYSMSYSNTDNLWYWLIDTYISSASLNDRFVLHCITIDTDFSFKFYEINVNTYGTSSTQKRVYTHKDGVNIAYNNILQNTILAYYGAGFLSNCQVILDKYQFPYTGSTIIPTIRVYDTVKDITLIEGAQYTTSIINNIEPGTATVTVTGINSYSGTLYKTFTIYKSGDPFSGGGISTTGGGDGNFDSTSEDVPIPSLPELSSLSSGLINLWAPTSSQLSSLVSWLWSSAFDIESFKKLFANPMDMIIGLSIVPVYLPTTSATVKFGNVDSGVSMYKVTQQYAIVDCGDINIEPFWGSYLDYSPYTKIDIFLPYIGFQHLDPDLVMNTTLNVTYHVDALTGACIAFICANTNVLYTFMGNCTTQIPISGSDWTGIYNGIMRTISNAATFAIGGANVGGVAGGVAGAAVGAASSMLTTSLKPVIGKSGTISSSGGMLDIQKPYIVINRPRQALPERQNLYTGYPSFITSPLQALIGYTEIEEIHLDNVPATDAELEEIKQILHDGFII